MGDTKVAAHTGSKIEAFPLGKFSVAANPRRGDLNLDVLAHNILAQGIQEPLAVVKVGSSLQVVSGHRRLAASKIAKLLDGKKFKALHPNGIPCYIRTDLVTEEDIALAKANHGTQQALTLRCEVYETVAMLLAAGATETTIAEHCEGLFAKTGRSMKSKVRDEIKRLKAQEPQDKKAIRKLYLDTYKGQVQKFKRIYACPPIVAAALEYSETDIVPVGPFKAEELPAHIATKHIEPLLKGFQADMEIIEDGVRAFSKATPGPNFKSAWDKVVDDVPVDTGPKLKRMSSNDMKEELKSGIFSSEGLQKLTSKHMGEKGIQGIEVADNRLHLVELMVKHQPDVWKAFEKAAILLKKNLANGQKPE